MPSEVWDEIVYPFLNFNATTVEVCECINNFMIWLLTHAGIKIDQC